MKWLVNTRENFGWGQLDLRIGIKQFNGAIDVVQPFTFKSYEPNSFVGDITLAAGQQYDTKEFLQACVDHAAEIGIFPTKNSAPKDEIAAIRYHLEDMRKLVFK